MEEIWKDIKGYEGRYQVSNLGNVRSLNYQRMGIVKNLKPIKMKVGYYCVNLHLNGNNTILSVHRLVGTHFIENPQNKPEINHKNGIKTDNRVINLEWNTYSENIAHSYSFLGRICSFVGKPSSCHPRAKMVNQLTLSGDFIRTWLCARDITNELGFNYKNISAACLGKRKTAYGFKWEFASKD